MLSKVNRARRMRMLLAFSAGALAIASMMTGAMSLALFSDQKTVNNSFTTGTITLNTAGISSLSLTSAALMPGDTKNGSVTVQNDGSAQLRYAVSATSTNPDTKDLRSSLTLTVKSEDAGGGCTAFTGTQLFTGTLGAST